MAVAGARGWWSFMAHLNLLGLCVLLCFFSMRHGYPSAFRAQDRGILQESLQYLVGSGFLYVRHCPCLDYVARGGRAMVTLA